MSKSNRYDTRSKKRPPKPPGRRKTSRPRTVTRPQTVARPKTLTRAKSVTRPQMRAVPLAEKLRPRWLRRASRAGGGALGAAIAVAALAAAPHVLPRAGEPLVVHSFPVLLILFAVAGVLALSIARRFRFTPPAARAQRVSFWLAAAPALADADLAISMTGGALATVLVSGAQASPLYPIVYAVLAFSATFLGRFAVIAALSCAVGFELSLHLAADAPDTVALAVHLGFFAGATLLHWVFLRGLVGLWRRDRATKLSESLTSQREAARDYRLIGAALSIESRPERARRDEEDLRALGSAEVVRSSLYYIVSLLRRSLSARTVVVLWLDDTGEALSVKELSTDAAAFIDAAKIPVAGVLGAVIRDRGSLRLSGVRGKQLPYYDSSDEVGAFVGVPVLDGPHLRGVLCVDRGVAFDSGEVAAAESAAEQIVHTIRAERVFATLERAKYEHERFFQASAMLCEALTLEQVMDTAFDAAAQIAQFDTGIIALYDKDKRKHRVYSVRSVEGKPPIVKPESLAGLEFRDNQGLASMVVKNRHYLPAAGELRDATAPVFTKRIKFKNPESLVVLPLMCADEAIGTFTLASDQPGRFRKDVREMLGVIANQVAISLQNGMMYKQMETMATTDGLTGLTNHRRFQERLGDLLERSERHNHQAALLLCDVDHFKSVNDTYGHPVGDDVLRAVARVLQETVRKIDITARYGGEEFAVVLEATDEKGAVGMANRIREEVAALSFEAGGTEFSVTMSIGVSTFPSDAKEQPVLIERADLALYHAKESGRNRVMTFAEFDRTRSRRAS